MIIFNLLIFIFNIYVLLSNSTELIDWNHKDKDLLYGHCFCCTLLSHVSRLHQVFLFSKLLVISEANYFTSLKILENVEKCPFKFYFQFFFIF